MNIVIGIPTGQRAEKAVKCVKAWKAAGVRVIVLTWDTETHRAIKDIADGVIVTPERMSFAKNHNTIARCTQWDVYICGADDLLPLTNCDKIGQVADTNPGKVIWVRDNLSDVQATHPIITKGWYEKHGKIFEECYSHNYCDTDLHCLALVNRELVRCFDIVFDHKHPLKTGEAMDDIYKIGASVFQEDKAKFENRWPVLPENTVIDYRIEEGR